MTSKNLMIRVRDDICQVQSRCEVSSLSPDYILYFHILRIAILSFVSTGNIVIVVGSRQVRHIRRPSIDSVPVSGPVVASDGYMVRIIELPVHPVLVTLIHTETIVEQVIM